MGTYRAVKILYRRRFLEDHPYEREFSGIQKFEPVSRTHDGLVDVLQVGRNNESGYFYYVMELSDDQVTGQRIDPERYQPRTLLRGSHSRPRLPFEQCLEVSLSLA